MEADSVGHTAFFLRPVEKGENTSRPVRAPECLIHYAVMVPRSSRAGDRQRGFYASGASSTPGWKKLLSFDPKPVHITEVLHMNHKLVEF